MEFNYLLENRAITHANGRTPSITRACPSPCAQLAKELLVIEATGDRAPRRSLVRQVRQDPPDLTAALAAAKDIPVDLIRASVLAES